MKYSRFGLMILTSTLVMFVLMYLNTYAWEHVFFSETRMYMAVLMGAAMALVMLGYMAGMYPSRGTNVAIFAGSIVVFALALWLVRSQATVSGESYMRAMIPHHSIAIMTSERAQIRDPRVHKLAGEIIAAQRREIAEMHYLIAELAAGRSVERIYRDPPATVGSVADALGKTLIAELDAAPLNAAEAAQVLTAAEQCRFNRSREADPILWVAADGGAGVMKLNGILIALDGDGGGRSFSAPGVAMTVRSFADDGADWRSNAELVFALDEGPRVGYRGLYTCGSDPGRPS
jgi:hypothetical protein